MFMFMFMFMFQNQYIIMGQNINGKQWNPNLQSKLKKIKTFFFDFIFIFLTNRIANPRALLLFDLLELTTLPFLYLNPIFTHLVSLPLLQTYFTSIYPILLHFHTNSALINFPACLIIYTLLVLMLAVYASGLLSQNSHKSKGSPLISLISVSMAFWPLMIFRISNEITHVWNKYNTKQNYGLALSVATGVMFTINLIAGVLVMGGYRKFGKVLDFSVGLAVFSGMNQYEVMGLLGAKIIATYFLVNQSPCKMLKLSIEASLYLSIILLLFIKPVMINYIILAIIIGTSILPSLFNILTSLPYKDLSTLKLNSQQDLYCTDEDYSFNQLIYFKKMNKHMINCADIDCLCRSILKVKGLKQLKKWIPAFEKSIARSNAINSTDNKNKKLKVQQYFDIQIAYIKFCTELTSPQQLDFQGYITLHKLHPQNIFQQYQKYHYNNLYSETLLKSSSSHLRMSIVNQTAENNQYKDILELQNKIQHIIKDIKQFWQSLIDFQGNNGFVGMIQDISSQINEINRLYEQIQINYDQKEEADYYYSIFRLVSLHERPTLSSLDHHNVTYMMVSSNQTIINMTVNLTHLLQKPASQLLGHRYTTLMHSAYGNDHAEWQRQFYNNYKVEQDSAFVKVVQVGPDPIFGTIKVVQMRHILMPDFVSVYSNASHPPSTNYTNQNGNDRGGVNVVTLIRQNYQQSADDEEIQKKMTAFHMLVNRQNLQIVAFESSIFDYFDVRFSIENVNKLLRQNLKKLFPNINKQAILNHSHNHNHRVLLAKQNPLFFENDDNNLNQYTSKISKLTFYEGTQPSNYVNRNKKLQDKHLQIHEVPSAKNKALNLLLLSFQLAVDCEQNVAKTQKTSHDVQIDLLKQKTLKNLMELEKSNKSSLTNSSPLASASSTNSNDSEPIFKIKLILCLSFLSAFAMMFSIYILFEYSFVNLQKFMNFYQNKSTFYSNLIYTQAYYLGFKVGQNRIDRMEEYWNYNQNPDLFAIFRSFGQQVFRNQFQKYVNSFQNKSPMQGLHDKVADQSNQIKFVNKIITIVFWCCLVLILINSIASLIIFVKSQSKSIKILSSFLTLNRKQIKQNLSKIKHLQQILQIQQFQQITNIQQQLNQSIPFNHSNYNFNNNNETTIMTIKQCVSLTKMDRFGSFQQKQRQRQKQKRKRKNQSRFKMKQQRKQQFQTALDYYFEGNTQLMNGLECQSSMSMMKTPQNSLSFQQSNTRMLNINYKYKEGIKQKQQEYNQSINSAEFSMSILSSIYKNVSYLIPSVIGLVLRLVTALFLLLFVPNLLLSILQCLQFKHNLLSEPLVSIQGLQSQYFQDNKFQSGLLAQIQYQNQRGLINLPSQFKQFVNYCNKMTSTDHNLCEFIDQITQQDLYWQCKSHQGLFKSGRSALIQFIAQKLRQVQTKTLSKQYLLQQNELSLSIKINLNLQTQRNLLYTQHFNKYYNKYKQMMMIFRIGLVAIFILCGFLQLRELRYTAERITRTHNLFKIVPAFMLRDKDKEKVKGKKERGDKDGSGYRSKWKIRASGCKSNNGNIISKSISFQQSI